MNVIDYNGVGIWSKEAVIERYSTYCNQSNIVPRSLTPKEHQHDGTKWIYPVMEEVIKGIEDGDAACKLIGIEFIEEDSKFPFGKILKSNTARALRRTGLTEAEQERVRRRIVTMLISGNVPHEYKEYAKLLRKIGVGAYESDIERDVDRSNEYVMKYYEYLKNA